MTWFWGQSKSSGHTVSAPLSSCQDDFTTEVSHTKKDCTKKQQHRGLSRLFRSNCLAQKQLTKTEVSCVFWILIVLHKQTRTSRDLGILHVSRVTYAELWWYNLWQLRVTVMTPLGHVTTCLLWLIVKRAPVMTDVDDNDKHKLNSIS